ncbi:hypothetical protein BJ875DRAFT_2830 [Amylocarpus encephaloides]|uniref:Secreted protein n=1 Tax=Amylocarpus encephaloides TaxID=45428 RepID=A0A9P7YU14_9HELO|nr:hypothetical protein BJ875DRAFT_2830 [Amylocarpus encephaloides]
MIGVGTTLFISLLVCVGGAWGHTDICIHRGSSFLERERPLQQSCMSPFLNINCMVFGLINKRNPKTLQIHSRMGVYELQPSDAAYREVEGRTTRSVSLTHLLTQQASLLGGVPERVRTV